MGERYGLRQSLGTRELNRIAAVSGTRRGMTASPRQGIPSRWDLRNAPSFAERKALRVFAPPRHRHVRRRGTLARKACPQADGEDAAHAWPPKAVVLAAPPRPIRCTSRASSGHERPSHASTAAAEAGMMPTRSRSRFCLLMKDASTKPA